MISLAINILWFALGVLILGAIVWVALWAVKQVLPVPAIVEKVVWAVFLILVLIYLLMTIQGGGHPFRFGLSRPAHSAWIAPDLQSVLGG